MHLHWTHAVAVPMLPEAPSGSVLPPLTACRVMRVGDPALVPYRHPGDPAVAEAIRGLAGRCASVLLANNGPVVAGPTPGAAVDAIEELEETAKPCPLLSGLDPRLLPPAQVAELGRAFGGPPGPHRR